MGNVILAIGIIILFVIAICMTSDFLSPACLVCESFALAFVCAIGSSNAVGWNFKIHGITCTLLLTGLLFFVLGSACGNAKNRWSEKKLNSTVTSFSYINCSMRVLIVMLLIQLIMFIIYLYYYRKTLGQFSGLVGSEILRARRFVASYGEGLEVEMPTLVNQFNKIAKAISYVNLYVLMYNWALKSTIKVRNVKSSKFQTVICLLSVVLYVPYSILNSARFEVMTFIIAALVMWYVCYLCFSTAVGKKFRNMRRAFIKILCVVILSMILMSLLSSVVGRLASETIFSEAFNYFGRSIQAFDESIRTGTIYSVERPSETFNGIVNVLNKLGIMDNENNKLYLEFISQSGISLGNTYTSIRRFYRDFNIIGVIALPFIQGFIMTHIYQKVKNRRKEGFDFWLLVYASIVGSLFLYCYEEFFYATYISLNYLIYFIFLYLFYFYASGRVHFNQGGKIIIRKNQNVNSQSYIVGERRK